MISDPPHPLAAKLNHLFGKVLDTDGRPFSNQQVADKIAASGGPTVSATYIWQLRKGLRDNPTVNHLAALAEFFGVPQAYFLDDEVAERVDSQLALLTALRDAGVQQVALRAAGVSPDGLRAITAMLEHVRHAEGLRDESGPPSSQPGKSQ